MSHAHMHILTVCVCVRERELHDTNSPTMRNATITPAIIRANPSSPPLLTGGGEGVLVSVVEGGFSPLSPSPSGVYGMGGFPPRGITEDSTTGGVGVGVGTADVYV